MQTSTYSLDGHTQVDGRRYVREMHVDDAGVTHTVEYLAPAGWTATEYTATMTARAAQIDAELAQAEFEQIVGEEV